MSEPSWLFQFPEMNKESLRALKKAFDVGYRDFSRAYGESIEAFFEPLLTFLVWFEDVFTASPWWLVIAALATVAWFASRNWKTRCRGNARVPRNWLFRHVGRHDVDDGDDHGLHDPLHRDWIAGWNSHGTLRSGPGDRHAGARCHADDAKFRPT